MNLQYELTKARLVRDLAEHDECYGTDNIERLQAWGALDNQLNAQAIKVNTGRFSEAQIKKVRTFLKRESIYKEFTTMLSFLIPHKKGTKLNLNVGGGSYTDGKTVTVGLPEIFIGRSEAEMYSALKALLGHETQHVNSSDFEGFVKFQNDIGEFFYKKYKIPKKYGMKIGKHIFNSVEDGRIEKILCNRLPGYKKHIQFLNGTFWSEQVMKGQSELEDFLYTITSYSVTGLYPKGFKDVYKGTKLHENIRNIREEIQNGIDAVTCQDCLMVCHEIVLKAEDYLAELLKNRTQEDEEFMQNMPEQNEWTTSEERDENTGEGSAHLVPKKKKKEEKEEEQQQQNQEEQQQGQGSDDSEENEEQKDQDKQDQKGNSKSKSEKDKEAEDDKSEGSDSGEEDKEEETQSDKENGQGQSDKSEEESDEDDKENQSGSDDDKNKDNPFDADNEDVMKTKTDENETSDEDSDGQSHSDSKSDEKTDEKEGDSKENADEDGGNTSDADSDDKGSDSETDNDSDSDNNSDSESKQDKFSDKKQSDEIPDESDSLPQGVNQDEDDEDLEIDEAEIRERMKEITDDVIEEAEKKMDEAEKQEATPKKSKDKNSTEITPEELKDIENRYKNQSTKKFKEIKGFDNNYSLPGEIKLEGKKFRKEVEKIFRNKETYNQRAQTKGILDTSNLWKTGVKDYNVFVKRGTPITTDYVAFILQDGSGSMKRDGKEFQSAKAMAVIEEGLKGIIPFKLSTFSVDGWTSNSVIHYTAKDWNDDSLTQNYAYNFHRQRRASGGNKDGYSIRVATAELLKRPEKDRILIVLSDGLPSDYNKGEAEGMVDVKEAVKEARKKGIHVVSLIFGSESFRAQNIDKYKYMYDNNIISCPPEEITPKLVKTLKKIISR